MELSSEAKRALVNTNGRQGASLPQGTPARVLEELQAAGLASPMGNLTRKGAGTRRQIFNDMTEVEL